MSRIGVLLVVIAALTLTLTVQASAATAPAVAPLLTSPVFASPVTIHWAAPVETTAAGHGEGPGQGSGDATMAKLATATATATAKAMVTATERATATADGGTASLLSVLRAEGPCGTAAGARTIATFTDPAISNFSDPGR